MLGQTQSTLSYFIPIPFGKPLLTFLLFLRAEMDSEQEVKTEKQIHDCRDVRHESPGNAKRHPNLPQPLHFQAMTERLSGPATPLNEAGKELTYIRKNFNSPGKSECNLQQS